MRRREFIALVGGVAAWPIAPCAQSARGIPTVGVLASAPASSPVYQSFQRGLHELGWIDGHNIRIEFRRALTVEQLPRLAEELVGMQVDVILAGSSTQVEPARQATKTIPIVFAAHADPIGIGHVASLPRPGGNITGLSQLNTEFAGKGLEILKEAAPSATRIGVLWNPTSPSHVPGLKAIEAAAQQLGIQIHLASASTANEFDGALAAMAQAGVGSLLVASSPVVYYERALLAEVVLKYRLPGMFPNRDNAEAGGLLSYGADINDLFRRASSYVDKILKGAKPGDLPVEQAEKYQLVINLKTAKALGITVPPSLLARADEVIE
jgi:putative ABC transport system substrate-binding protein